MDHLLCIVYGLDIRKITLSTERFGKMSIFRSTFYRFKFETIYPQEFDGNYGYRMHLDYKENET